MRHRFHPGGYPVADRYSLRHGQAHSATWLYIAKHIGVSVAEVSATWMATVEHASKACPRGSAERFPVRPHAEFFGLSEPAVNKILNAFIDEGLVDHDWMIVDWADMQGIKPDRTATERKRRQRERGHAMSRRDKPDDVTPCHGVTDMSRHVTVGHAGGDIGGGNTLCDSDTDLKFNTPCEAQRASARSAGDVLQLIEQAGIRIGIGNRVFNIPAVRGWVAKGVTPEQITEAIGRARRARDRAGDSTPLNLGYLRCFVDDVLAGMAERSKSNGTQLEANDERVAEFIQRNR